MKNAFLIIDMQNDFIDGSLGSNEAQDIVPVVKALLNNAKVNNDKIIFTRDTHSENYLETREGKYLPVVHCIENTHGWKISSELDTTDAIIIDKKTFGFTGWEKYLDDVDTITLVGLCTDICVISNALIIKAMYPEKTIKIVENATAGVTVDKKEHTLDVARSCHLDVIQSTDIM